MFLSDQEAAQIHWFRSWQIFRSDYLPGLHRYNHYSSHMQEYDHAWRAQSRKIIELFIRDCAEAFCDFHRSTEGTQPLGNFWYFAYGYL